MFRVDHATWIDPNAVGISVITIDNVNHWGDEAYLVHIEAEVDDFDSEIMPTFEEAEAYVQRLLEKMKC